MNNIFSAREIKYWRGSLIVKGDVGTYLVERADAGDNAAGLERGVGGVRHEALLQVLQRETSTRGKSAIVSGRRAHSGVGTPGVV